MRQEHPSLVPTRKNMQPVSNDPGRSTWEFHILYEAEFDWTGFFYIILLKCPQSSQRASGRVDDV